MDEHPDTKNTTCPGAGAVTPATAPAPKTVRGERRAQGHGSAFDPHTVKKRQRRLTCMDEIVQSLSAKRLKPVEVAAHFAEVFGTKVSKGALSRITKVVGEMAEWQNRPLDRSNPGGVYRCCPPSRSATGNS